MESRPRTLWLRTEPLHSVIYFDAECRGIGRSVGLKGFWMGYFATRTAPMGPVLPETATAVLAVFAPGMVARALPAAWQIVTPERLTDLRAQLAARALRRLVPGIGTLAEQLTPPLTAMVEDAGHPARPGLERHGVGGCRGTAALPRTDRRGVGSHAARS
ncbi:helix-turn-helix domain-containing protein [Streptomyces sp. NBC_00057]|uniref:helix-turn-helix domain-containing protein n=1 Tax=Streptomyces sp. NBC_00057 TaxID=2975634 RepID=UPI00324E1E22